MKRFLPLLLGILLLGCDSMEDGAEDTMLEARTIFTSTSLATGGASSAAKSDVSNTFLTPTNVSGEVVSLLFAISGVPDEGIVIFGDARPDIAPANSTTFAFDFAEQLAIVSTPSWDTTRPGGQSEHMALIFAHLDLTFEVDSQVHVTRVALVSNNGMQRGDKLMEMGSGFEWYDLDTDTFTATRPSNPARVPDIENFFDSIRPNMVFYPFNAFMTNPPLSLLTVDLLAAIGLDIVLDFNVLDMIALEGVTSTAGLTAEDVIQNLTFRQVLGGLGNSGIEVDATATIVQ